MPANPVTRQEAAAAAKQAGLSPRLAAIMWSMLKQESGRMQTRPNGQIVTSSAGALGAMQLMPGTARGLGVNPYNEAQNLRGGATYLRQMYDQFKNERLAVAAYNSGPGNVSKYGEARAAKGYVDNVLAGAGAGAGLGAGGGVAAAPSPAPSPVGLPPDRKAFALELIRQIRDRAPVDAGAAVRALQPAAPQQAPGAMVLGDQQPRPHDRPQQTQPGDPNDGWGGSYSFGLQFAQLGLGGGLKSVSEKRDRRNTTTGGVSDHYAGNTDSYAWDLSDGDHPTAGMDAAAHRILARLGVKWDGKSPVVVTRNVGNYRVQVLYRTQVGGNHDNHIHVGVRRIR